MHLPMTSLTALACGIVLLVLTLRVIVLRRRDGIVMGDNNDRGMAKAIRGQANAAEQIPIALIIMGLAETQGAGSALGILGGIFVIGRVMHGAYFAIHGLPWRLRFYGMLLTALAQTGFLIALAVAIFG